MRKLLLLILMSSLTGCAGLDFQPKRWVDGDTFYSTKLPSIEVKVNNMSFNKKNEHFEYIEARERVRNSDMKTTDFYFWGDNTTKHKEHLQIKIESLNDHKRVVMATPDYSKFPHSLSADEQLLAGMRFSTGIFVIDKNTYALLAKAYGRVVGETTRYQIVYMEHVGKEWLEKKPRRLTREYSDYLANFNQRAESSFTINTYGSTPAPKSTLADKKAGTDATPIDENIPAATQQALQAGPKNHVAVFPSAFDLDANSFQGELEKRIPSVMEDTLKDIARFKQFQFTDLLKEKSLQDISWNQHKPNLSGVINQAEARGFDFVVLYYFSFVEGQGLVNGWGTDFHNPTFRVFLVDVHNQAVFEKKDSNTISLDQLFIELKGISRQLVRKTDFPN